MLAKIFDFRVKFTIEHYEKHWKTIGYNIKRLYVKKIDKTPTLSYNFAKISKNPPSCNTILHCNFLHKS